MWMRFRVPLSAFPDRRVLMPPRRAARVLKSVGFESDAFHETWFTGWRAAFTTSPTNTLSQSSIAAESTINHMSRHLWHFFTCKSFMVVVLLSSLRGCTRLLRDAFVPRLQIALVLRYRRSYIWTLVAFPRVFFICAIVAADVLQTHAA